MSSCTDSANRLATDAEVHDAALWRLANWSQHEIEAATQALSELLGAGVEFSETEQQVRNVIRGFKRAGDRRSCWSAACAVLVFLAEARGDIGLYWRTGLEVLSSYRQALRGLQSPDADDLDEIIEHYLRRHEQTTAGALYEHCADLAPVRMVVQDANHDRLTYRPDKAKSKLKTIGRHAFEMRVSRIRQRLAQRAQPEQKPIQIFHAWQNVQPVAVNCEQYARASFQETR